MRPRSSLYALPLAAFTLFAVTASAQPAAPAPASAPAPALAAAPVEAPRPLTVEEACDPLNLQPMLSKPAKKMMALVSELDRRAAATLAEERRHEEQSKADLAPLPVETVGALCVASLALVLAAIFFARQRGLALVVALLGMGAAFAAVGLVHQRGDRRATAMTRTQELTACHLRLVEMRTQLQHAELAKCIGDMDEADEDLMGFLAKLKSGGAVTPEEITKLHDEVSHSMRE